MKRFSIRWKSVLALLCASFMLISLISCAPAVEKVASKGTKFQTDLVAGSGSEVNLTFWHGMGGVNGTALQGLVDGFNTQYAGIVKVTAQYQGAYDDEFNKLKTATTAGSGPNIAQVYDIGTRFMIDSGWIVPVQDAIDQSSWDVKQLEPMLAAYYTVNEKLYGMPFNSSAPVLYYNKDQFTAAGLDPNSPPKTFADIVSMSSKLTKTDASGKATQNTIGMYTYGWFLEQSLNKMLLPEYDNGNGRTKNPTKILMDSNGGLSKFLTAYNQLITSGAMPLYAQTDATGQAAFIAGKLSMYMQSTAQLKTLMTGIKGTFQLGVAFFPSLEANAKGGVSIGGAALYMMKNTDSRVQQAEWMFLKYMSSASVQATWSTKTGYYPANVNAQKEQTFKDNLAKYPQFQIALDELHASTAASCGGLSTIGTQARKITEVDMQKVNTNAMTVSEAVTDIASQINSALSDYNAVNN